ncbi:MAG: 50S ribosomal protein L29 [Candidatus Aenigmarchaeota archaeon]|nr:50S ribosomal protein L29 [Candidatus Aenigmarchaeota archaeon]
MAILRKKEIKNMSEKDMEKNINEFKLELAKEKANIAIGATVTSPGRIREIRKTIARIETVLTQRRNTSKT